MRLDLANIHLHELRRLIPRCACAPARTAARRYVLRRRRIVRRALRNICLLSRLFLCYLFFCFVCRGVLLVNLRSELPRNLYGQIVDHVGNIIELTLQTRQLFSLALFCVVLIAFLQ